MLFHVVLLHTCRPDLIDWARVCLQTPRENLQLAFDVAERVYNVTRLLDPEGNDDDDDDDDDDCDTVLCRIFNMRFQTDRSPRNLQFLKKNEKIKEIRKTQFQC